MSAAPRRRRVHAAFLAEATRERHQLERANDWTALELTRCGIRMLDAATDEITEEIEAVTCAGCASLMTSEEWERLYAAVGMAR